MGPTDVQLGENANSPTAKFHAEFFSSHTVDAPPPVNQSATTTISSSGPQRALRSEALRCATFQGWPHSYLSPRSLSSAGFFYRGQGDQTQCAFCCITISHWEPNDNPMSEHRLYAPNCPFVLGLPVGNVPLATTTTNLSPTTDSASSQVSLLAALNRNGQDTCSRFRHELRLNAHPEQDPPSSLSIRPLDSEAAVNSDYMALRVQPHQRAHHPELATLEARLNTFRDWPPGLAQRPAQLAEAGFYYMRTGDHVKCFSCDGALRNWEPTDEPWTEHARWFSGCNFLSSIKGEDFVKEVHNKFKNKSPVEGFAAPEDVQQREEEKKNSPVCEPLEQAAKSTDLKEAILCKICFDQQMSIVFLPCGHSLSCPSCAAALSTCPLCRKPIQATVRAYFSFS